MQIKSTVRQLFGTSGDSAKNCVQHNITQDINCSPSSPIASIMVVEDDVLNQVIASKILTGLGYTVILANNGQDGIEKLASADIDLILMDMQMPVMDGIEATQRLRAQGYRLPILGFTASTSNDDHQRCREAGMQGVLIKPMQLKALTGALAQFLVNAKQ